MTELDRLTGIFRQVFLDDTLELRPDMTSIDVDGWDSFAHLNIITSVESEFGIEISDEESPQLKSVAALISAIGSARRGKQP